MRRIVVEPLGHSQSLLGRQGVRLLFGLLRWDGWQLVDYLPHARRLCDGSGLQLLLLPHELLVLHHRGVCVGEGVDVLRLLECLVQQLALLQLSDADGELGGVVNPGELIRLHQTAADG